MTTGARVLIIEWVDPQDGAIKSFHYDKCGAAPKEPYSESLFRRALLGRFELAPRMKREVYSGRLKLNGKEHIETLIAAQNYESCLGDLEHYEGVKSLLRRTIPVTRRVLGDDDRITLTMRTSYALALFEDEGAALDDLHESVETLEDANRIARRVLGASHPTTAGIERTLIFSRAALSAREPAAGGGCVK